MKKPELRMACEAGCFNTRPDCYHTASGKRVLCKHYKFEVMMIDHYESEVEKRTITTHESVMCPKCSHLIPPWSEKCSICGWKRSEIEQ